MNRLTSTALDHPLYHEARLAVMVASASLWQTTMLYYAAKCPACPEKVKEYSKRLTDEQRCMEAYKRKYFPGRSHAWLVHCDPACLPACLNLPASACMSSSNLHAPTLHAHMSARQPEGRVYNSLNAICPCLKLSSSAFFVCPESTPAPAHEPATGPAGEQAPTSSCVAPAQVGPLPPQPQPRRQPLGRLFRPSPEWFRNPLLEPLLLDECSGSA